LKKVPVANCTQQSNGGVCHETHGSPRPAGDPVFSARLSHPDKKTAALVVPLAGSGCPAGLEPLGDKQGIAKALVNLGVGAWYRGDYAAAQALFAEGLILMRDLGDGPGALGAHANLGFLAVEQCEYATAQAHFTESLRLARDIGDKLLIVYNLVGLAAATIRIGSATTVTPEDAQRATRLVAAAEAILSAMKGTMEPEVRSPCDRTIAAARIALDKEAFDAAWTQGRAMTMHQAITYAREEMSDRSHLATA
jgi:tetratricopeptide (TPR) repeat protein